MHSHIGQHAAHAVYLHLQAAQQETPKNMPIS